MLAGCSFLADDEEVSETFDETYGVDDGTRLSVLGRNGPIDVAATDGDAVEVVAEKRSRGGQDALDEVALRVEESGGSLRVRAVYPENRDLLSEPVVVDFEVRVPDGVVVDRLETANGAVTATGVAGDAALASSNGSVTADDVDGYVSLRTSNGPIEATDVTGLDRAVTTNGSVDVALRSIRADVPVETTNGDVTLRAAEDPSATFDLETSVGSVSVSGLSLSRSTDESAHVVGDLNGGGHRVAAETTTGSVTLRAI